MLALAPGSLFDRNLLDSERSLIAERLRNRGYFAFAKDYITFIADTAENSLEVDLTLVVNPPRNATTSVPNIASDTAAMPLHEKFMINKVIFVAEGTLPAPCR